MKNWIFYIIAILFFQFGLSQSNQIEDFDSIVSYEVKKKETLYNISKKFNITVNNIYLLNPELRGQKLKKKSIISIPLKKVKKNFYLDSSKNQKTTDLKTIGEDDLDLDIAMNLLRNKNGLRQRDLNIQLPMSFLEKYEKGISEGLLLKDKIGTTEKGYRFLNETIQLFF